MSLQKYQDVVSNPPKAGDVLNTLDGSPALLTVHVEDNKPPFIFGRAFVNEILGTNLGWYLRGVDDEKNIGWKCVLMTKARREVVKRCNLDGVVAVKSLRVVRPSESGKALLCEVAEFLAVEELPPPEKFVALSPETLAEYPDVAGAVAAGEVF
jgi:hypothetical protein